MHNCPNCPQELSTFAFYCPRCQRPIGELRVDGDILVVWWVDARGEPSEKWAVKTFKSGTDYLNLIGVSPSRPSASQHQTTIEFTVRPLEGDEQRIEKRATEVFAEVSRAEMQEWQIK
jgi:hypothetical protein